MSEFSIFTNIMITMGAFAFIMYLFIILFNQDK